MKKKILGEVAVIAIAALAAFNMDVNNKQELSAIGLANVEALARREEMERLLAIKDNMTAHFQ